MSSSCREFYEWYDAHPEQIVARHEGLFEESVRDILHSHRLESDERTQRVAQGVRFLTHSLTEYSHSAAFNLIMASREFDVLPKAQVLKAATKICRTTADPIAGEHAQGKKIKLARMRVARNEAQALYELAGYILNPSLFEESL